MSDTVKVFVVVGDAGESKRVELGLFFRVTDADAFLAGLSKRDWSHVEVVPKDIPLAEVHPAHNGALPTSMRAAHQKLLDVAAVSAK